MSLCVFTMFFVIFIVWCVFVIVYDNGCCLGFICIVMRLQWMWMTCLVCTLKCVWIFFSIWFYLVSTSTLYVRIFTIFYVWWSNFDMQMFVCIYNFVCVIRNLMGCLYACVFAMLLMFECLCICNACVFVLFLYLQSCL